MKEVRDQKGIVFHDKDETKKYTKMFEKMMSVDVALLYRNSQKTQPEGFGFGIFGVALGPFHIETHGEFIDWLC